MIHHVLSVTGMTCDHCAATIEKTLRDMGGVQTVKVSYAEGKAWVDTQDTVQVEALLAAMKRWIFLLCLRWYSPIRK